MDHTSCRLRLAAIADAPAILEIYAQYMDTPITFETELPSLEEFEGRIRAITAEYPWIVCEDETGRIIGYAYGHKQLERAAYRWNAELSEYLDSRVTSKGIGKRMLLVLLELLKAQGIHTVYSLVTSPNLKSDAMHNGGCPAAFCATPRYLIPLHQYDPGNGKSASVADSYDLPPGTDFYSADFRAECDVWPGWSYLCTAGG